MPNCSLEIVRADPKPFLGYSDNTNLLNWLWNNGVAGFYGGSTQVHLGPGPAVDDVHAESLRAALLTGERLEQLRRESPAGDLTDIQLVALADAPRAARDRVRALHEQAIELEAQREVLARPKDEWSAVGADPEDGQPLGDVFALTEHRVVVARVHRDHGPEFVTDSLDTDRTCPSHR